MNRVSCTLSNAPITVGQKLDLVCSVNETDLVGLEGSQIRFKTAGEVLEHSIAFLGEPTRVGGQITQTLTSYKVGQHQFSTLILNLGEKEFVIDPPVSLDVKSVIEEQAQPTPYPNYAPQSLWAPLWWWVLWGSVLLVLASFIAWQIYKRRKLKAARAARDKIDRPLFGREKFNARMRKLESQSFHMTGQFKSFALELSQIMRSSIGEELKFAAEDLTTEELISTLQGKHRKVYASLEETLKPLLLDLDQIKFAKKLPTPEECRMHLDRAYMAGRVLFGGPS